MKILAYSIDDFSVLKARMLKGRPTRTIGRTILLVSLSAILMKLVWSELSVASRAMATRPMIARFDNTGKVLLSAQRTYRDRFLVEPRSDIDAKIAMLAPEIDEKMIYDPYRQTGPTQAVAVPPSPALEPKVGLFVRPGLATFEEPPQILLVLFNPLESHR